jgi:importin-4
MEEKEEAIIALKELAEYGGAAFVPYIQVSFEEIYKLLNYPNEDIRQVKFNTFHSLYQT